MEPLDLTVTRPRGVRQTILGYYFLPRTIDKLRAELPGGNIGPFLNHDRGFSAFVVRRLGLDMDEFRNEVAAAPNEGAVINWLAERIDPSGAAALNAKLDSFTIDRMTPEDQQLARERHPVTLRQPQLNSILDVIEADDEEMFRE